MDLFENIFYILLISWIVVEHPIFNVVAELINYIINKKNNELLKYILTQPTKCFKCSAFYVGIIWCLIFGLPWWIPILTSWIMYIYDSKFNTIEL